MELVQVGKNTYYIKNATNIGIYMVEDNHVYLIDSGSDSDAGKKVLKIINERNFIVDGIICTHSNADHIGGNKIIQDRTGCKIFAHGIEKAFCNDPILESSFLYGGYPFKKLQNKFLMAPSSKVIEIDGNLPKGLEYFSLKGHFFDMIGIKTSDDVYFLADSLFSEETIKKYHVFFVYDVRGFFNTLNYLSNLIGNKFILSHEKVLDNIERLIQLNQEKLEEILKVIYSFCEVERTFEEILSFLFSNYQLTMNENQYVLISSTLRSYLSYLCDEKELCYEFQNYKMVWHQGE